MALCVAHQPSSRVPRVNGVRGIPRRSRSETFSSGKGEEHPSPRRTQRPARSSSQPLPSPRLPPRRGEKRHKSPVFADNNAAGRCKLYLTFPLLLPAFQERLRSCRLGWGEAETGTGHRHGSAPGNSCSDF